jgi:hypothetical protein
MSKPIKTYSSRTETIWIDNEKSIDCTIVPTFYAHIYVGLQPGYDKNDFQQLSSLIAEDICQEYCNKLGMCVTVENLEFIYTNGRERGVRVGIINYPRFPKTKEEIIKIALVLGNQLKEAFSQYRVSVLTPESTYMIGKLE